VGPGSGERAGFGRLVCTIRLRRRKEPSKGKGEAGDEVSRGTSRGEPAARRGQLASAVDLEGGGRRGPSGGVPRYRRSPGLRLSPTGGPGSGERAGDSDGWCAPIRLWRRKRSRAKRKVGQWRGFTWNISRDPSARTGRLASTVDLEGGGRRGPSGACRGTGGRRGCGLSPTWDQGQENGWGSGGWHARSACEGGREPTKGAVARFTWNISRGNQQCGVGSWHRL
jgi:hypothetical protein